MDALKVEDLGDGWKIEIHADEDSVNPRMEWDNASTMICWHRRYDLGDSYKGGKAPSMDPEEFQSWIKTQKGAIVVPLGLLDHSGLHIYAGGGPCHAGGDSAGWDSGTIGFAYILRETIHKEWGKGPAAYKRARACIAAEIKAYDDYLTGSCYGFIVRDPAGENVDSCWGFLGDMEYCLGEARAAAKCARKSDADARAEIAGAAV